MTDRIAGGIKLHQARIRGGVIAVSIFAALGVGASAVAHADDESYLNNLTQHGYQVMWQSRPFLLSAGNGMCNDLRSGQTPEQVADHWNYPNATHQNLVDMATAAQHELCPDTMH